MKYFTASAEFTRPSDTTAYAAGDVVGPTAGAAVITFSDVGAINRGYALVRSVYVEKNNTNVTLAAFALHLYTVAPIPIADNLAWTNLYADRAKYIGYFSFPTINANGFGGGDASSTVVTLANVSAFPFRCASGSNDVYGVLVATAAYVPASAEQFYVCIGVEQGD